MTLTLAIFLLCAGFLSGMVNAIAGGGTFLTFGAMTLAGLPPITANATSAIAQLPGYVTSSLAYWSEIRKNLRSALLLAVVSIIGGLGGSYILLLLDNPFFRTIVPWLLVAATALFAAGPWLTPKPRPDAEHREPSRPVSAIVQFVTSVYGGFFGAGMGIMMLATLALTEGNNDYHRLNALKNLLSMVIATVAIVIFVAGGVIDWASAFVLLPAVAAGGYAGVWTARRLSQSLVRALVVATGTALAIYYFVTG